MAPEALRGRMPLTIWTNTTLAPAAQARLEAGIGQHRLIVASKRAATVLEPAPRDPRLAGADIAFGQPSVEDCRASVSLKWIAVSSAGYTRYDTPEFQENLRTRGVAFTTMSSVFAEPCAQHVLAMMLALARELPASLDEQRGERRWRFHERRGASMLLNGQTVLLLGYGNIAKRIVELLRPFGMRIFAVRRRAYSESGVHVIAEDRVTSVLGETDHVINVLPDNEATRNYVNARRLAACKPGARFYNIGRGTTVDERALMEALESGRLGAAYLDVFQEEPLPPTHPLWTTRNCYITPHTAGGRSDQDLAMVKHFLDNLAAFERGREGDGTAAMLDRV